MGISVCIVAVVSCAGDDPTVRVLTSLHGDDRDVVPLLALAVQLGCRGDEACIRGNVEQGLRVRLGINGEPEDERDRERQREGEKRHI